MVAALLPTQSMDETLHPYILVQVETLDREEIVLVDSGSCYNVISYEFFSTLKSVPLTKKETQVQSFMGKTACFIGTVQLKLQVG